MSIPSLTLPFAVALLLATVLSPEIAAASGCPNYPYPFASNRCVRDGFCGRVTMEARTTGPDGQEDDLPSPSMLDSTSPVEFGDGVSAGGGDLYTIGSTATSADRSVLSVTGTVDSDAPGGGPGPTSATGNVGPLAVFRTVDLVFSGPTSEVETSLNLVLDGSYTLITSAVEAHLSTGVVALLLGGGLCQGGVVFGFEGQHQISQIDEGPDPPNTFVAVNSGLLQDIDLDGETEFVVGPFTAPTDQLLQIELWMQASVSAGTTGGNSDSTGEFTAYLGSIDGGPVFDLPPGYSADSPELNIVANFVPEPSPSLAASMVVVMSSYVARRRGAG